MLLSIHFPPEQVHFPVQIFCAVRNPFYVSADPAAVQVHLFSVPVSGSLTGSPDLFQSVLWYAQTAADADQIYKVLPDF